MFLCLWLCVNCKLVPWDWNSSCDEELCNEIFEISPMLAYASATIMLHSVIPFYQGACKSLTKLGCIE